MWRKLEQKVCRIPSTNHRSCTIQIGNARLSSVYGDPNVADYAWCSDILTAGFEFRNYIAIGDFNWRGTYSDLIAQNQNMAPVINTTTENTAPTRCIATTQVTTLGVEFLAGIHLHGFVTYQLPLSWPALTHTTPKTYRSQKMSRF